jgi:hypothetical protein
MSWGPHPCLLKLNRARVKRSVFYSHRTGAVELYPHSGSIAHISREGCLGHTHCLPPRSANAS